MCTILSREIQSCTIKYPERTSLDEIFALTSFTAKSLLIITYCYINVKSLIITKLPSKTKLTTRLQANHF